ncbi:protein SYM1 [Pyrus x bretschneideri]|uniref:protein SYM1 n=1 Tax=Pyrus x bretschneideri TaxID=225117 RepID=UPI00202E4FD3|nr:protein SYM1 [Pyrus x bretschneideri]
MTAALRWSTNLTRLLQKNSITDPFRAPKLLQTQTQTHSKAYLRFPQVFRKARDYDLSPSVFSSAFSSAKSSVEAPSVSKLGFVGWYLGMIESRPVLTKSVTAALIYTAADLSSQTLAKSSFSESYDLVRTARMAGYGMLVLGPSLHFWFNFMSKSYPKRDIFSTLKKMAMGQVLFGPTMTFAFFSLNACLQGENGGEIVARLQRDLFPTLLNGVMYWPICDFITFRFIPVHLQPLVSNGFSYLWTIYITYMAGLEKAGTAS